APLEEEVAPVTQLVREARPNHAPGDAGAGLDRRDDERHARIGELGQVARPALDDVARELRLPECWLHPGQEPPGPCADLLGEPEAREELEPPHLLEASLGAIPGPGTGPLVGHEALGIR